MIGIGTPCQVGSLLVTNRLLRSATMEYMADTDGRVTDDLLKLYYNIAWGGAGLIITGCASIEDRGRSWEHQLGIWDDSFVEGLSALSGIMHTHREGCKCAVQISHQGSAGPGYSYGAASGAESLESLTDDRIQDLILMYGEAARRVKEAGFDAVQVHGAHGYLVSQFLSPAINKRHDRWGGSPENRARFAIEVYHSIRSRVGEDFPILWKLNTADYIEDGADTEEYALVAKKLRDAGVDLIEMSGGIKEQISLRARLKKEAGDREAYFEGAITAFRTAAGDTPLALTGGIRTLSVMEHLLKSGIDLIGVCRPVICEPDFPERLLQGPDRRTAKCTSCNKCLRRIAKQAVKCVEFDDFRKIVRGMEIPLL